MSTRKRHEGRDRGLQDRLAENKVELQIVAPEKIGAFARLQAGATNPVQPAIERDRLLASRPVVSLAALRATATRVQGRRSRTRHPPEILERVFDRFESNTTGSRHRGVGLASPSSGPSWNCTAQILIDSTPGEGTVVTAFFPASGEGRAASEHQFRSNQTRDELDAKELMREVAETFGRKSITRASSCGSATTISTCFSPMAKISPRAERSAARRDRLDGRRPSHHFRWVPTRAPNRLQDHRSRRRR